MVILDIIGCAFRVYYALQVSPILIKEIFTKVLVPTMNVAILNSLVCWLLAICVKENSIDMAFLFVVNSIALFLIIYIVGVDYHERHLIDSMFEKIDIKKKKN